MTDWPFGELRPLWYELMVIDPPWDFENYSDAGTVKGADPHYKVQPLEWIQALPVSKLARKDCLVLLWSTGCMLPQCVETMKAWGVTYKSEMVWRKLTKNGKPRMGTGYRVRTMHEPVLVGTIGNPKHKAFPSVFDGEAREHSRKPDEFYALVENYAPKLFPRLDMFSRQSRHGWESFGNERGKFDAGRENLVSGAPG